MLLKIRTRDDQEVCVQSEDLQISNLISMLIENMDEEEIEIPLLNVPHSIFMKVLDFTRYHLKDPMKKIEKPLKNNHLPIQPWYMDFISLEPEMGLYEMLEAATYLDIEPLEELVCARIASLIKGNEYEELKKIFGFNYNDGVS